MTAHTITVRNVNDALPQGLAYLKREGVAAGSRVGKVITAPGPVLTVYDRPWERVLFNLQRDANPFFHIYEALYYLAGGNRVEPLANYVVRMREFSDDGVTLHGAYGHRWRSWFGFDQIVAVIQELRANPNSRRAVLTMWSPAGDLVMRDGADGLRAKDLPCNTHIYLRRRAGTLDMTVLCRSNDLVWGAYGANAVHFSVLQEYLAAALRVKVGKLYQFSNDFHIYKALPQFDALWAWAQKEPVDYGNPYEYEKVIPLVGRGETAAMFLHDVQLLVCNNWKFKTRFMIEVAAPLLRAHAAWKAGRNWKLHLRRASNCDWRSAAEAWLVRHTKGYKAPKQQLLDAWGIPYDKTKQASTK